MMIAALMIALTAWGWLKFYRTRRPAAAPVIVQSRRGYGRRR